MIQPSCLSVLFLLGVSIAQAPTPRPSNPYRSDIDALVAALRRTERADSLPAIGGDSVPATSKILCAMAECHRRYHISDGPVVRPSVEYVVKKQGADGSFGDAAATAWAVAALSRIDPDGQQQVLAKGRSWLVAHHGDGDPFATLTKVAQAAWDGGSSPGLASQKLGKEWLANQASHSRGEVAEALLDLAVCQVAGRPPEPAAQAAAVFSTSQQHGLDWLMSQQQDGVFSAGGKPSLPLSGFGLMALQSKPKAKRSAPEQAAIDQGLQWLLTSQNEDGTWGDTLQNYTTCVAVGALDRSKLPAAAPALAKAQRALLAFQNVEANGYSRSDRDYGSIGYGGSQRGDISNLHFSLQALRQTGLQTTDEAFAKALVFLQRTQNLSATNDFAGKVPDPERPGVILDAVSGDDGGAAYYPGNSSAGYIVRPDGKSIPRSYGSMTYALLKAYALAGLPGTDQRVRAAVGWIQEHWELAVNPGVEPEAGPKAQYQGLFYYYLLMAQALDTCGIDAVKAHHGDQVASIPWREALRVHLERMQREDGTWLNEQNGRWMESSPMLCTCYALLALERCR